MSTDPARIPWYIAASAILLALAIVGVGGFRREAGPGWLQAGLLALTISAVGVLLAKYGANIGLPWWLYYTAPMLATVLLQIGRASCRERV